MILYIFPPVQFFPSTAGSSFWYQLDQMKEFRVFLKSNQKYLLDKFGELSPTLIRFSIKFSRKDYPVDMSKEHFT